MAVDPKLVRDLREATGAGMMDCKKALEAAGGDFDAAKDHLRAQGAAKAEKKSSRSMGEGRIFTAIAEDGRTGAAVAMSCETDFVAKTPEFVAFGEGLAQHMLANEVADTEALMAQAYGGADSVEAALKDLIGKLGENMSVARAVRLSSPSGRVGTYLHHDLKKLGIAAVKTEAEPGAAEETLKALCMHVVFNETQAMRREDLDQSEIERERAIFLEQVKDKPENIQDKIVSGKLESYYADRVLPEQPWIHENKTTVAKTISAALGAGSEVEDFAYVKV